MKSQFCLNQCQICGRETQEMDVFLQLKQQLNRSAVMNSKLNTGQTEVNNFTVISIRKDLYVS